MSFKYTMHGAWLKEECSGITRGIKKVTWRVLFPASFSRGKAIQMHLGRLHLEVRPLRRADAALQKAHRSETLQVRRLWPQLLQIRPPGPAQTETHAGVNQMQSSSKRGRERKKDKGTENTHVRTHAHSQAGGPGSGISLWMFSAGLDPHNHTHSSFLRRWTKVHRAYGAENRVTSRSSGFSRQTQKDLLLSMFEI